MKSPKASSKISPQSKMAQDAYSAPPEHVIDSRAKVPFIVRLRDLILTILLWAMYIYFMIPFFHFLEDVYHWAAGGFENAGDYQSFQVLDSLKIYLLIIAIMITFFVAWALYNMLRFRNKTRRRQPDPVSAEELATLYGFPLEKVESWQQAQTLVMHHDKEGLLTNVVIQ